MTQLPPTRETGETARPTRRLVAGGIAATALTVGGEACSSPSERPALPVSDTFPLRLEAGKRFPSGRNGAPFLIKGDAPWSLIANLSREDAVRYLDDRQARGFNTLLVSLIEHKFAANAPNNFYNEPPFTTPNDFSTPNEAYFAHAEYVLEQARARGFLVLLAPAYIGWEGGDEGWYQPMAANGGAVLREYGRYVGNRLSRLDNILWVDACDYNPPNKALSRAVAEGVRSVLPNSVHTAHCARNTSGLDIWRGESWLDINTAYTSDQVVARCLREYAQPERMPYFLIEAVYENESGVNIQTLRLQCYAAVLSGAFGHVFGNDPIWSFDAKGTAGLTWRAQLDSPGAHAMTHAWRLFDGLRWDKLVPDVNAGLLLAGRGAGNDTAAAALAADRSFALIYAPSRRTLTVDLGKLAGPNLRIRWFDPSVGAFSPAKSPPLLRGRADFPTPAANAGGQNDWLLLIESV